APSAVTHRTAQTVTDSTAKLTWRGTSDPKAVYNVFRSEDPDAPATAYTMVARVRGNEFADHGLHVATDYYYRIAGVSAGNLQGPLSPVLKIKTSPSNTTAPHPVHEMGIVRRAPDTLFVYWRKNTEPDVASYRVFRGESPDFSLASREPVAVLPATAYFLQLFHDSGLKPNTTYYYRVQPVDWSNNVQSTSPVVSATTPKK
ncbi:MAG: fibronectin type III domain-containing protein, partial [Acidimicrobiia bacterium]